MEEFEDEKELSTSENGSLLLQLVKVSLTIIFSNSTVNKSNTSTVVLLNFRNLISLTGYKGWYVHMAIPSLSILEQRGQWSTVCAYFAQVLVQVHMASVELPHSVADRLSPSLDKLGSATCPQEPTPSDLLLSPACTNGIPHSGWRARDWTSLQTSPQRWDTVDGYFRSIPEKAQPDGFQLGHPPEIVGVEEWLGLPQCRSEQFFWKRIYRQCS
jgi:hypothetical protein